MEICGSGQRERETDGTLLRTFGESLPVYGKETSQKQYPASGTDLNTRITV